MSKKKDSDPVVLRRHAEDQYADELAALTASDDKPRPPSWKLSPAAVATYLLGGKTGSVAISPKYVGSRRLIEIAITTLATDRALLLLGVPGTALEQKRLATLSPTAVREELWPE